ncbi:hypothetical protein [Flaviaesturariibacter aridisoli]|uniref:Uncharacterized protein n=1 Tax=Flaviaesturariibacter aridisoli TaxID=2545761 RepID=A0A4V2WNC0_9BACT|nr:hypothetical protein [Flaviaesturariibacter aridisoli]TCZ74862.1 hypothetical protein E0486_00725 [Flaviaesturariibacter aridisoli]
MNQQADVKRNTIISVLNRLRTFNPQVGHYVRSALHTNFYYATELDNGSIEIPANLVNDYEEDADYITDERYRSAAARFIPDKQHAAPLTDEDRARKNRPKEYIIVVILAVLAIIFILTLIL